VKAVAGVRSTERTATELSPAELRELKARLVAIAREAGGGGVRVCAATPDAVARARMEAAFARGDLATWEFDARRAATAADPANVLAGARSVIALALPYATRAPARRASLTGRVSNYAWGSDYHKRARALGRRIATELDGAAGARVARVVCDTAPLDERAFAARAGLGWIGKHTNLIVPGAGSFVFLAEVVTTLELPPDEPLRKTCGTCTRCLPACPTGALRGDYTMDATRCISDLTQRADAIPLALRPLVGDWVWGCDLCQEACPPTRQAGPGGGEAFEPRDDEAAFPDLIGLLQLRGNAYRRTRRTAMGWRGAAILRRNAAVGLGNALDRSAVPALVEALAGDPHPLVRGHAAWALGRIGSPAARAALQARAGCEPDPSVRREVALALESWETNPSPATLQSPE
jgi:epoxyqueuosine reductase